MEINSAGPTEVVLSWPGPASDFVLEQTRQLSAFGWWEPVTSEPTLSGADYTVKLASAEHARFFRLRYQPSALRSTSPAISFALATPDGTNVVAGQPLVNGSVLDIGICPVAMVSLPIPQRLHRVSGSF